MVYRAYGLGMASRIDNEMENNMEMNMALWSGYIGMSREVTPIMGNQMEEHMENEMEPEIGFSALWGLRLGGSKPSCNQVVSDIP